MNDQPDQKAGSSPVAGADGELETPGAEHKRLAARRRFLRMGAGGPAAVVVTVMHKRAFAGTKKTPSTQSLCGSIVTPDLKGANQKNVLQQSSMGTPKGLVCRPQTVNTCTPGTAGSGPYYNTSTGSPGSWQSDSIFKNGCGSVSNTLNYANDFRLYNKGYCPIKINPDGSLAYDTSKQYYAKQGGSLVLKSCQTGLY